jgi:hypothetical protein
MRDQSKKKSPSGTTPTARNSQLSSAEVCSILETSAKAGVSELKFGGLEVKFGKPAEERPRAPGPQPTPVLPVPVEALTEEAHTTQSKESLELESIRIKERQFQELLITNPLLAEQMIENGELADGSASSDDAELSGDDEIDD